MANDAPLTPERLSQLVSRLDEVMTEAARLRKEVTRQLSERRQDQQKILPTRKRRTKATGSSV